MQLTTGEPLQPEPRSQKLRTRNSPFERPAFFNEKDQETFASGEDVIKPFFVLAKISLNVFPWLV
jgi:hypothetical protein